MADGTSVRSADVYAVLDANKMPWSAVAAREPEGPLLARVLDLPEWWRDRVSTKLLELQAFYGLTITAEVVEQVIEHSRDNEPDGWRHRREAQERRQAAQVNAVVYYARIGDLIKIGTTVDLPMRMRALAVDELLATEPGDHRLERMRLQQFAHLRVKQREYHSQGADLISHIYMLRAHSTPSSLTR